MSEKPPFLGDVRLKNKEDIGKSFSEIKDFEIWDGSGWVDSKTAMEQKFTVEEKS